MKEFFGCLAWAAIGAMGAWAVFHVVDLVERFWWLIRLFL